MKRRAEKDQKLPTKKLLGNLMHGIYYLELRCPSETRKDFVMNAFKTLRTISSNEVQDISEDGTLAAIVLLCEKQCDAFFKELPRSLFSEDCIDICSGLCNFLKNWKDLSKQELETELQIFRDYWVIILIKMQEEMRNLPEEPDVKQVEFIRNVLESTKTVKCALHESLYSIFMEEFPK